MPVGTFHLKSDRNSTHRSTFKKGYILTVKVEKIEPPVFVEKLSEPQKKQFIRIRLLHEWWVILISSFGCEQIDACLYGKAGNLWRKAVAIIGKPGQI